MTILGISAYFHDSAAALIVDGIVVAAAQEERFTRVKHDNTFPINACRYCIKVAGGYVDGIDCVVFYEKPFLRFERIIETIIDNAPYTCVHFLKAMPLWLKERLNMRSTLKKQLKKSLGIYVREILFVDHHLSHAAMSYYTSPYDNAAIVVTDAVGEWATTSIFVGHANEISLIEQQNFPHSIGMLYSAFTYFLGFKVNSDEYKVMGLAPYGDKDGEETKRFIQVIRTKLVEIHEDGSITLNMKYFTFAHSMKMVSLHKWEKLMCVNCRKSTENINRTHCNLAYAIQSVTEEILIKIAKYAKRRTKSENLCLSGGVALNCAVNGHLREKKIFNNIFIPVSPGDGGSAIGAALAIYYKTAFCKQRINNSNPYLGPEYDNSLVKEILDSKDSHYSFIEDISIYELIADEIAKGKIIGWFQGRMEFGPRALGCRSILADPRDNNMKHKINQSIKFREEFRPFAPIVMEEDCSSYFNDDIASPYMMFTTKVKDELCIQLPANMELNDAIVAKTSRIPAVTHIDKTARVQTVNAKQCPRLYLLLSSFKKLTGCSVLLNTSFNVMGEPIVCSPEDAINTFYNSGIDILVINNYIIYK